MLQVSVREGSEGGKTLVLSQERFSAAHKCNTNLLWKVRLKNRYLQVGTEIIVRFFASAAPQREQPAAQIHPWWQTT
jgi:hypothetical protein